MAREWYLMASNGSGRPLKTPFAVVVYQRGLAVHDLARASDGAAVGVADALVAQADSQCGRRRAEPAQDIVGDAGLLRRARPGGDDDLLRVHVRDLLQRGLIVADHLHLGPQLAEILIEVIGEAVVVVDE